MRPRDGWLVGRCTRLYLWIEVEPTYDVFLGHASADKAAGVRALADELERLGLRTFVDERAIGAFDSITREVEEAIAGSLVFVAWYSHRYPERRACQLELRRAYVAAEGAHQAGERIFAVNPESGFVHIQPATLRDARIPSEEAAEAILARVESVRRRRGAVPLGGLTRLDAPTWIPQRRFSSPRFVGPAHPVPSGHPIRPRRSRCREFGRLGWR